MKEKNLILIFGFIISLHHALLVPNCCTQASTAPCKKTDFLTDCLQSEQIIPNLGIVRKQVRSYFESGMYEKELLCIARKIKQYISSFSPPHEKYALVFDIDDTLLSTWPLNKKTNCGYDKKRFLKWELSAKLPAVKPMRNVYNRALQKGFSLFLITGRKPHLKEATIKNLNQQGFYGWKNIFFSPLDKADMSRAAYKSSVRKSIQEQGYTIIATIGDQLSDLQGGYAKKSFKLPNPMYYIP